MPTPKWENAFEKLKYFLEHIFEWSMFPILPLSRNFPTEEDCLGFLFYIPTKDIRIVYIGNIFDITNFNPKDLNKYTSIRYGSDAEMYSAGWRVD